MKIPMIKREFFNTLTSKDRGELYISSEAFKSLEYIVKDEHIVLCSFSGNGVFSVALENLDLLIGELLDIRDVFYDQVN